MNKLLEFSIPCPYFLYLLLFFSFLSFLIDIYDNPCFYQQRSLGLYLFLFGHHFLALFLYFGWLSSSPTILLLYCFTVFIIILHWITNDQKCVLTQVVNYYCNLPDREGFHDIFYYIGFKQKSWFNNFIYSYLIIAIIISIYKLYQLG